MTTAEEALARAKAIAARLSGGNGTSSSSPTAAPSTNRPKRNRWGVAPSIVTTAAVSNLDAERSSSLPGLAEAMDASSQKKQKTLARKRVWIKTSRDRPESHFYSYFHDRLPRITETMYQQAGNSEDAKDEVSKVSILLKGRGSSNVPPPPGQPEEPMHVLIIGPESLIDRVDPLVDDLMFEAERAPPENIGELSSDPNSALTVTPSQSLSSYRPATVAQLLNQNALALPGGNIIEEEILVPNGIVGYLIGRGGENITSMQARSNCKVQIQKEHDLKPGQTDRVITLVAATQESIDQCREIIESMVKDRVRSAGGLRDGVSQKDMKVMSAVSQGHALVKVEVPDANVGLIIGKGGITIKRIQELTGASIQIPPTGNPDNPAVRTISVTHPDEQGANAAKQQIEMLLASKPTFEINAANHVTVQIDIPDQDVGLCIGRGGVVIKRMQNNSGARIEIPSECAPGSSVRAATISGSEEGCAKAKEMIEEILSKQSSYHVLHRGRQQNQNPNYLGQQYSQNGGQNNGEYSAEWQAFYAAQAVANQQQQPAPAPAPAPAVQQQQQGQPAKDSYHEQFFRYAYYYGEDAARKYYGAWSPSVGTPNPYGTNPNGVSPAPTAAEPAPAQAPAPSPSPVVQAPATLDYQNVRDTSVRKVSNLPAWMTKGK